MVKYPVHRCGDTSGAFSLAALLELGDGTGVLAGLGVDKATTETTITDALAAVLADQEMQ